MNAFFNIMNNASLEFQKRLRLEKNCRPEVLAQQIARRLIPLRSEELLALASENLHLALKTPRSGPAFTKRATPVNLIAGNLFEAICASLKSQNSVQSASSHKEKLYDGQPQRKTGSET